MKLVEATIAKIESSARRADRYERRSFFIVVRPLLVVIGRGL
jgi:hypothetical protein